MNHCGPKHVSLSTLTPIACAQCSNIGTHNANEKLLGKMSKPDISCVAMKC